MALPIPKRYIPAINKIRNLSDSAVSELIHAIESAPIMAESEKMAAHIAARVSSIPSDDLSAIVEFIYGIYYVREYSELTKQSFLIELTEGIQEIAEPEIAEHEVPRIRERFQRLLNIETLNSFSKAITLQQDGERLYCKAKIISDIRPVFGPDVGTQPVASVIIHTLKLSYHEEGNLKEFFIVLDQQDLEKLEKIVARARSKSESLNELLKGLNLPRLGI